jgi:branched-chain amino acid transport system permease protein
MSARDEVSSAPVDALRAARPRGAAYRIVTMVAILAVLTAVIAAAASGYWLKIFTASFAVALAAAGTSLLYGRLGLISLCQYALVGVGGWVTLRVFHAFHPPFEVSLLAGGVAAGAVGVLWGLPAIRMRGLYLALATLMLAGAFQVVINNWAFPNGGVGLLGYMADKPRVDIDRPPLAAGDAAFFIYVAIVLALGLALLEWHRHAKPGRAWALISRSELMAAASGVRVVFYKTWAFALSGFLAGIAGGLLAACYGGLDPNAFPASVSILLFAVSVIGGVFDWPGAVIAGIMFQVPPALLNYFNVNGYFATLLFGAGLVHALITAPTGVSGQLGGLVERLGQKAPR